MTEVTTLAAKARSRVREILQGAASLRPGDEKALSEFLKKLPIESSMQHDPAERPTYEQQTVASMGHNTTISGASWPVPPPAEYSALTE
jgi:hypothetical protein